MQGLTIKAVAKLSGLSVHTLRAWERRYAVIKPVRSKNGRRVYSMSDVKKLKLLSLLTERGHSISLLVPLKIKELEALVGEPLRDPNHFGDLLKALRAFDLDEIERQIMKARINMPVRSFVMEVAGPLLSQVGVLVDQNEFDISQEHALSAILRTHLGELITHVQKSSSLRVNSENNFPRLIFSTREGDLHEFGILLAAVLAGSYGFKFHYLGPNTPAQSLAFAAKSTGSQIIVIGSVKGAEKQSSRTLKKYIDRLSESLTSSVKHPTTIWIGGFCDFDCEGFSRPVFHAKSFSEFESLLKNLTNGVSI